MLDFSGFEAFYAAQQPGLWAYLVRIGAQPALAADLSQDAFLRWLGSPARHAPPMQARAYLYAIASNLLSDHWRRHRRDVAWDSLPEMPAHEAAEFSEAIPAHAWRALTARQRQLLWLAYAEGFSHDEIARICAVSSSSVRVLLFRARAQLTQAIDAKEPA